MTLEKYKESESDTSESEIKKKWQSQKWKWYLWKQKCTKVIADRTHWGNGTLKKKSEGDRQLKLCIDYPYGLCSTLSLSTTQALSLGVAQYLWLVQFILPRTM